MRIRATRHLYPNIDRSFAPLSDEERARLAGQWDRFKRKLKLARILAAEELLDEARDALREAILCAGRAIAVEARLSEPEKLEEVIVSPLAARWGECQTLIHRFLTEPSGEIGPLIEALQSLPCGNC